MYCLVHSCNDDLSYVGKYETVEDAIVEVCKILRSYYSQDYIKFEEWITSEETGVLYDDGRFYLFSILTSGHNRFISFYDDDQMEEDKFLIFEP